MLDTIVFAPLQGLTDYRYRNTYRQFFGGIDVFYAPYLRKQKGELRSSMIKDVKPENNENIRVIPQIMTNSVDEFVELASFLTNLGYDSVNWNLGCPYPMVTKRQLGSGLLPHPDKIIDILEQVLPKIKLKVSLKMRSGLEASSDINAVLPRLNAFPLDHIIIHPRIGKELYKGLADVDVFKNCIEQTSHPIGYNGDILSVQNLNSLKAQFPSVHLFMMGRGILANPFLPEQIRGTFVYDEKIVRERLVDFYHALENQYAETLTGDKQLILRMLGHWEYLAHLFEDSHKAFKRIKKASNRAKYKTAVNENLLHSAFNESILNNV